MNTEQTTRMNDAVSNLLISLISAYAIFAAQRFAKNLCGNTSSVDVSRELNDWREAESQLRHAYAIYVTRGTSPAIYLSRPDDHGERENAIRRLVYTSLVARMSGRLDALPNIASLPPLPARTSAEKAPGSGR
jgi:hypothetical protein